VNANMVTLFLKLPSSLTESIPVVMAMSPEVNSDLILTNPVVKALLSTERNDTDLSTPPELLVQNDAITDTSLSDDEDTTDTEDEPNASLPIAHDSSGALSICLSSSFFICKLCVRCTLAAVLSEQDF